MNAAGDKYIDLVKASDAFRQLKRDAESNLSHAYLLLSADRLGLDILAGENVVVEKLMGHGGFFKTPLVGQKIMAAAAGAPVAVMKTAGEGGPWGMALLAAYMAEKQNGQTLEDYLQTRVFAGQEGSCIAPDEADKAGFAKFITAFTAGLSVEKAAVEHIKE